MPTRTAVMTAAIVAIWLTAASAAEPPSVTIWPGPAPGVSKTGEAESFEDNRVYHVNDPSLIVYLPPTGTSNGQAVIVCPGGGYTRLAIGHEGHDIARWLNSLGITAFILKYRMYDYGQPAPLADAQRAIRFVRSRAKVYGVNPGNIGIMGFSAGGHVASSAGTHFDDRVNASVDDIDRLSARPDFMILIYPVVTMNDGVTHAGSKKNLIGDSPSADLVKFYSNELHVTKTTPPAFIVHASDDTAVPVENSLGIYRALVANGVPAEMHIYETGGHGFGLGTGKGPAKSWPGLCAAWLKRFDSR